ncbi:Pregnancy-specific beta-1-glycoprotein 5 [Dissostichus eleginoides]|uniref:Pregnancy-specific beta-1-glycoprotein 5 n=1 Tax=Dissostichus eleginoides TaxID=100907 RepID=A0AAD9BVE8_DISEL|nr:Pregnancy-specific beta-1-glycoprotein 5 [Dissostichus eleginoides]
MSEFRRIMMSSFLMLLLHFTDGQIHSEAKAKSDRLRVTENCSLVIKNVTEEDAGLYTCKQFRPGEQQGSFSPVYLSVVTMTEHQDNDEVKLRCCVKTYGCPQSSGDATTTGTPPIHEWTSENNNNKETGQDRKHPEGPALWRVLMVSVGLAALIISVVTVHIWTRTKGGKKRMRKNLEQNDEDEDEVNYENDGGASASV